MNAPCQTRFPGQIDQLLVREPSPRKMRHLRAHLMGCPACQHRYNKIMLANRLLEGGPQALTVPSEGEINRVGEEVMHRVRLVPDAGAKRAHRGVTSWVAAIATCGVVLAIALPLVLHKVRPPARAPEISEHAASSGSGAGGVDEYDFHPRGGISGSSGRSAEPTGVRAFCITRIGGLPQVNGLAPSNEGPASCRISEVIKFAYTNHSQLAYLFLVGVDEKYAIKWYEPHPPARQSVKVKSSISDEPLPRAVRLGVNHQPGQLRVFALFSASPLGAEQIEQAVAQVQKRRTPLSKLAELPIGNCHQQSLLIRLHP